MSRWITLAGQVWFMALPPSLAGVLDAGKVLIDQTGAALRKAFEPTHGTR